MFPTPDATFGQWKAWRYREKIADACDVPATFDSVGLYMLARFVNGAPPKGSAEPTQIEVVYIGKSHRLTS
jgi:hypothetical protein